MRNDRNKELALIHIGKKQLDMDEETYRKMLWTVGRAHSSGDLDAGGREAVIKHLRACGFTPERKREKKADPDRPHTLEQNAQLRKIGAQLAHAKRPWKYAKSMAKRMYGKDALEFCTPEELNGITAALWKDGKRRERRAHEAQP